MLAGTERSLPGLPPNPAKELDISARAAHGSVRSRDTHGCTQWSNGRKSPALRMGKGRTGNWAHASPPPLPNLKPLALPPTSSLPTLARSPLPFLAGSAANADRSCSDGPSMRVDLNPQGMSEVPRLQEGRSGALSVWFRVDGRSAGDGGPAYRAIFTIAGWCRPG